MLELGYSAQQLAAIAPAGQGTASLWSANARGSLAVSLGVTVDAVPTKGSIAQLDGVTGYSSGHVAVVEEVHADGTITVSESSYSTSSTDMFNFLWRHRTVTPNWFTNFIHVSKSTAQQLPDLVISSITATPTSAQPGATISVNYTVTNNGSGGTAASTTRIRLASGTTITASDPLLDTFTVGPLASGQSLTITRSATIPSGQATGSYYMGATANADVALTESNTNNNQNTTPFSVTQAGTQTLVLGLDASSLSQPSAIDWNAVSSVVSFVILRASKGNADIDNCRFTDPKFVTRAAAIPAGLALGAYHVASIRNDATGEVFSPTSEAAHFVSVAGNWIKEGGMRPFLDVEDHTCATLSNLDDSAISNWVDQWMQEVRRLTGVTPLIYANIPFVNKLQSLAPKYELWGVANACVRDSTCSLSNGLQIPPWVIDLVQYDWHGHIPGISEEVDLNVFHGSQATFQTKLIVPSGNVITPGSPDAPTNVIGLGGNASATVSFTAPTTGSTPTSYTASCLATGQTTRLQNGPSSPIVVSGLANGITYSCSVVAINSIGSGSPSGSANVTPVAPGAGVTMSPPTNVNVALSGSGADLSWIAPTGTGTVSQYKIYLDGVFSWIVYAPFTTFFNGGVASVPGTYSYTVAACPATGACSSQSSPSTLVVASPGDSQAPTIPTNLVTTPVSGSQINLKWTAATDNVGVTKYQVLRAGVVIATVGNITNYSDNSGLSPSTTYSYTVKSGDTAGNWSQPSLAALGTTLANVIPDQLPPSRPTGLTASAASSTQINLTWTASSDNVGVTGYLLYRGNQAPINVGNVTSYPDTGLASNAIYSYRVVALDAAGNTSDFSATAEAGIYTVVPVPLAVTKIAGGSGHMQAVKNDGTGWAWGTNFVGQLGNNSTSMSTRPVQSTGLTGVSAVAAGSNHSMALKADQTVWAWGQNSEGQLGNNSIADSLVPVQVSGLSSVVAIAGGVEYSAALKSNNTVWAWGKNSYGQLGACASCQVNNGYYYAPTPIQVFSPAKKIAVGSFHALAVKTDGTVWVWGSGTGITSTPTMVSGLSGVTDIAGGSAFSVALSGGAVWTWGLNNYGQLGLGNVTNSAVPQHVSGLPSIAAIAAGVNHVIALDTNGNVWTWGYNSNGLGYSNITSSTTPIQIPGLSGVTAITAGAYFSAALRADGTLWTWGDNGNGQLGDDNTSAPLLASGQPCCTLRESLFDAGLLSSIAIVGPGSLAERTTARYTIVATYDNGSALQVPGVFSLAATSDASLSDTSLLNAYAVTTDRTVTLSASYAEGSITKAASLPVTIKNIAGAPGAPTQVAATVGIGQAVVSFTAPLDDGGSPITTYTVTSTPGGIAASGTGSTITVTGLTFGTSYTFTVAATNAIGTGPNSAPSSAGSTVTVPSIPTGVTAVGGDAQATITFTAPANGGSAITGYTVLSNPAGGGDADAGSTATSHRVLGLANGTAYTFSVIATNALGSSAPSNSSNSVTPLGASGAPTGVSAVAGNAQATVTFTAPVSNGGSNITGYTVSSNPTGGVDSKEGTTALTHTITGLTNGTAYTFTVTATNSTGTATASASSNSITPQAPQSITFGTAPNIVVGSTSIVSATGGASGNPVTFTSTTTSICTVSGINGNTVTGLAAGTCTIAANQAGNASYAAAAQATQSIVVGAGAVAGTPFINDQFDGTTLNSTLWTTGGNSATVHDGYLDLQANQTDNTGWVKTIFSERQHIRVEVMHNMHPANLYFFPNITLGTADPNGRVVVEWTRSAYDAPGYCTTGANYDRVQILAGVMPNATCGWTISNLVSSSYYDRWVISIFDYDASTGVVTLDADGDGTVDFSATVALANRSPVTSIQLQGYGWWTGHSHTFNYIKVFDYGSALAPQTLSFATAPTVSVGGTGTLTATGGASGNAVTFTSTTPSICTVSGTNGSTVTGVAVGTCTIAANQAGNASYAAATQATQSFNIAPATISATLSPTASSMVSSAGGTGTVSVTTVSGNAWTASSNASWITITSGATGSGNGIVGYSVAANATAVQRVGTITIAGKIFTVTQAVGSGWVSFVDTFDGTALQSTYWNITGPGAVNVAAGLANFACRASADTSGRYTVSGNQIVIESRMVGTGLLRDTVVVLVDVVTGDRIQVGDTNYWGGLYSSGSGAFSLPPLATGTSVNVNKEYRLTINGTSLTLERGDTLANITETSTRTLGASIAGKTFYLLIGTGGPDYCPGSFDWVRVMSTTGNLITAAAPGVPTSVIASAGNTQATVTFSAPVNSGSAAVTGYTVTSNPAGGVDSSSGTTALTHTITGLTNGVAYTFTVTATNNAGTGLASTVSSSVTPMGVQTITFGTAPTVVVGGTGTVSANGGTSGNAVTFTSTTTSICTVSGTNGSTVTGVAAGTCTIAANQAGNASYRAATQVTQNVNVTSPIAAPGAPTGVSAIAGNAQARVSFSTPGTDGGAPITNYTVTSTPGGLTATGVATPITINGLANGTAYTFAVVATNSAGNSAASGSSNTVIPTSVPNITEFSTGITANANPRGIAAGSDGNLWFTEVTGNRIGRITPDGVITEFSAGISAGAKPARITSGPDGNLWFTEQGLAQIGRITPDGVVTEFSTGISSGAGLGDIVTGSDGNLWFTEYVGDRIGRITPDGVITEFGAGMTAGSGPLCIAAGPDGNLWFTEFSGSRIGRITPQGTITEFSAGISANAAPTAIAAGPDGNVWFAEQSVNRIGMITTSGVVTEYSTGISAGGNPYGLTAGLDGNLWFTEYYGNRVGQITTAGVVTEFGDGISPDAGLRLITVGPAGNLWFTEWSGRIGRIIPVRTSFTDYQTITFGTAPTVVVGGSGTVSATGGASGNAVTFTSATASICTLSGINGSTVTGVAAGTCTIAANQAGNATYSPAPQVVKTITVAPTTTTTTSTTSTTTTTSSTTTTTQVGNGVSLAAGWNLLGNSLNQAFSVVPTFADTALVTTVWKWDVTVPGWQFYTPTMTTAALQTYAISKGYGVLSVINPGEGYWVNAKVAGSVSVPTGTAYTLTSANLVSGWNLVATGKDVYPATFNMSLSDTPPSPGVIPPNVTSLWAWDNAFLQWYFYAPNLEANGTMATYINSKGYLDFAQHGKTLGKGTGFWVNRP